MAFSLPNLRQRSQDAIRDLPALKNAAQQVAAHIIHGAHGQKKSGGYEKFWQFREYSPTDRPQDIDWRQSAKTDHVFVREKELQTPQSVYFWVNTSQSMRFQSKEALYSKLEAAQILCFALALLFARSDERVGIFGQNQVGVSEHALDRIGRVLLENHEDSLPHGHAPSKSTLILMGDFLSPIEEIETAFSAIAGRNAQGIIVQILDPAERDLPYNGHVVFDDHASGRHTIDNISSIRDAYQDNIQTHLSEVKELCESFGWSYYTHVTDQSLNTPLHNIREGGQR